MKLLFKALRLHNNDRNLLFKTFILLSLVRLGLWLLPFQKLLHLLGKIGLTAAQELLETVPLDRIVWAVNLNSSYTLGNVQCLPRALTTQVLMRMHGYTPQLRIGVAKGEQGNLEAHAWVENQGQVVIGYLRDFSRFTPLPSFKGSKL
jgi:Transglutaminase-like superfamily